MSRRRGPRTTYACTCERCGTGHRATIRARYCPGCRYLARSGNTRRRKHQITEAALEYLRARYDGKVRGRSEEIARKLGWPRWMVNRKAAELGLSRPADRRSWTAAEDALLEAEIGRRTVTWIARRLGRSAASVTCRSKRLQLSRRRGRDYMTQAEVAIALGCDHRKVASWIRRGWLRAKPRGTLREVDTWEITERACRDFLREHPLELDLRRADPLWLIDILAGVKEAA